MTKRLDVYLTENKYFESRSKATQAILAGAISVNDEIQKKSSFLVEENTNIKILKQTDRYVSRAGYKLEGAIQNFGIDFSGKVVLDIGASTGGFTDCALQHGAKKVFAVDTGSCQLHESLKSDKRIVNLEKTNAIDLDQKYFDKANIIVCDVSFVSGVYLFQKISSKIKSGTPIIWLIKPQFECGKRVISKFKGVITNENLALQIAENAIFTLQVFDFEKLGFMKSPIKGGDGNCEFLAYVKKK